MWSMGQKYRDLEMDRFSNSLVSFYLLFVLRASFALSQFRFFFVEKLKAFFVTWPLNQVLQTFTEVFSYSNIEANILYFKCHALLGELTDLAFTTQKFFHIFNFFLDFTHRDKNMRWWRFNQFNRLPTIGV